MFFLCFPKGRAASPKRMNFWKSSKRGGGVISNPKIYVADFGHLNRAFWAWNWYKRVISGYVFQQLYWEKSKQDTFWRGPPPHPPHPPTMFRKFIRFGDTLCPYTKTADNKQILSTEISWKFGAIFESLPSTCCHACHHSRGQDQDQCMYHVHVLHTIWPSYRLA